MHKMIENSMRLVAQAYGRDKLIKAAEQGIAKAIDELRETYHAKVYTNEEVRIVNLLRRSTMEELLKTNGQVDVREMEVTLDLPSLNAKKYCAQLNWLSPLVDVEQLLKEVSQLYLAGLTYCDAPPYDDGSTVWVVKKDAEKGFVPLFCALYWIKEASHGEGDEKEKE